MTVEKSQVWFKQKEMPAVQNEHISPIFIPQLEPRSQWEAESANWISLLLGGGILRWY